jgi:hypothetical protein
VSVNKALVVQQLEGTLPPVSFNKIVHVLSCFPFCSTDFADRNSIQVRDEQNHDIHIGQDHGNWEILIIARLQG